MRVQPLLDTVNSQVGVHYFDLSIYTCVYCDEKLHMEDVKYIIKNRYTKSVANTVSQMIH